MISAPSLDERAWIHFAFAYGARQEVAGRISASVVAAARLAAVLHNLALFYILERPQYKNAVGEPRGTSSVAANRLCQAAVFFCLYI
jgi:hypothetical protein